MVADAVRVPIIAHVRRFSRIVLHSALICCLGLPPGAFANSQHYVLKGWGADERLTEGSVTDVAQTPEGYLWVGTLFGSVLRVDGGPFVCYKSANTPHFSPKWGVTR